MGHLNNTCGCHLRQEDCNRRILEYKEKIEKCKTASEKVKDLTYAIKDVSSALKDASSYLAQGALECPGVNMGGAITSVGSTTIDTGAISTGIARGIEKLTEKISIEEKKIRAIKNEHAIGVEYETNEIYGTL